MDDYLKKVESDLDKEVVRLKGVIKESEDLEIIRVLTSYVDDDILQLSCFHSVKMATLVGARCGLLDNPEGFLKDYLIIIERGSEKIVGMFEKNPSFETIKMGLLKYANPKSLIAAISVSDDEKDYILPRFIAMSMAFDYLSKESPEDLTK